MKIKELIIVDTNTSTPTRYNDLEVENGSFAGLKKALPQMNFSNKAVVEASTRNSLELDDSKLPNEEKVILFVTTRRIKAGHTDVDDMSRSELMAACKEISNSSKEGKKAMGSYTTTKSDEIRQNLKEWYANQEEEEEVIDTAEQKDPRAIIVECADNIIKSSNTIKEQLASIEEGSVEIPTLEELENANLLDMAKGIKEVFSDNVLYK